MVEPSRSLRQAHGSEQRATKENIFLPGSEARRRLFSVFRKGLGCMPGAP